MVDNAEALEKLVSPLKKVSVDVNTAEFEIGTEYENCEVTLNITYSSDVDINISSDLKNAIIKTLGGNGIIAFRTNATSYGIMSNLYPLDGASWYPGSGNDNYYKVNKSAGAPFGVSVINGITLACIGIDI